MQSADLWPPKGSCTEVTCSCSPCRLDGRAGRVLAARRLSAEAGPQVAGQQLGQRGPGPAAAGPLPETSGSEASITAGRGGAGAAAAASAAQQPAPGPLARTPPPNTAPHFTVECLIVRLVGPNTTSHNILHNVTQRHTMSHNMSLSLFVYKLFHSHPV